jgi:hypothetical protein
MNRRKLTFILSMFFILAPMVSVAKDGEIIKRGKCSNGVETELKASPENGQIEVEYELGDAVPGSRWRIRITKNGKSILRATQRANAAGDIEVRQITTNLAGREMIRATAKRTGAAGACTVSLPVTF